MKNKTIICLTGKARAGKDTVADRLVSNHGFTKMAFADVLRKEICIAFNLDSDQMLIDGELKDKPNQKLSLKNCKDTEFVLFVLNSIQEKLTSLSFVDFILSPRAVMQYWGDYRRSQNPNYLIDDLTNRLKNTTGNVVVSDCRSDAEAAVLSSQPFKADIWKITNPRSKAVNAHKTENGIDQYFIDRWLDNSSTIENLYRLTDLFLKAVIYGSEPETQADLA